MRGLARTFASRDPNAVMSDRFSKHRVRHQNGMVEMLSDVS